MNPKLQKLLAELGLASRRRAEEWIKAGRVIVDGRIAHLGQRVALSSQICIDGRPILNQQAHAPKALPRVLLYHKPRGEICSRKDTKNRPTIFERLPHLQCGRWINIGRLDVNTSGLLLLSTSGEIAHQLMHPSFNLEREYHVRIYGETDPEILHKLKSGVMLDDGEARFDHLELIKKTGKNSWYRVVLKEGRNRIVRRLWQSQNIKVNRLIRVRFGDICLPETLEPGEFLELSPQQVHSLTRKKRM